MKKQLIQRCVLTSTCLFIIALGSGAFGQGALTPPGAPVPMMKTLDQIEPRTPITSLPFVITAPGSYYLVTNLTGLPASDGIIVQADHVTIDLRGFALLGGGGGSGGGIVVSNSHMNLRVCNGSIANWAGQGIKADTASNSQFEHLRISQNGLAGLQAGHGSTIDACVVANNGTEGVSVIDQCLIQNSTSCSNMVGFLLAAPGCRINDCVAANNNSGIIVTAVNCSVNNCTAALNAVEGIHVSDGCRIDLCVAINNQWNGIVTGNGCTVKNCTSNGNVNDGIQVGTTCCWVNGNTANGNGGAGIRPLGDARIDDNIVYNNNVGIICTVGGNNFVARNTAHANVIADYSIPAGNKDAAAVANPNAGAPWSNFSY